MFKIRFARRVESIASQRANGGWSGIECTARGMWWLAKQRRGGWDEVRKEARGGPLVRGPHSTDNVTFFNPRFTLFVLASAARKAPKQLTSTSVPRERIPATGAGASSDYPRTSTYTGGPSID